MTKFVSALMGDTLLNAELRKALWTPATLNDGTPGGFAVGWTVGRYRGRAEVGHSGGPALSDTVYFPEEKLAVIVLTNQRKLTPLLAHGVANFYLTPPAFLNEPGIPDALPARTTALKQVLTTLAQGRADASPFTGALKTDIGESERVDGARAWGPASAEPPGPAERVRGPHDADLPRGVRARPDQAMACHLRCRRADFGGGRQGGVRTALPLGQAPPGDLDDAGALRRAQRLPEHGPRAHEPPETLHGLVP